MAQVRRFLFTAHLWVAVILCLLLVPLGLSGVVLQWPEAVNATFNPPPRVGSAPAALPPAAYFDAARAALPEGARLQSLRLPRTPGEAVTVTAAAARPGPGRGQTVWMEPASARVLKVGAPASALFRLSHDFHETLLIEGPGRQIVGYLGIAMLLLALSGLWLWWPRGAFTSGFRWRRTPSTLMNLHHLAGFWIALPLAFVSLTGIGLAFPKLTAAIFGAPAGFGGPPGGGGGRGPGGGGAPYVPMLSPNEAAALATAAHPEARLAAVTLPGVRQPGPPAPTPPGGRAAQTWRIELIEAGKPVTVRVGDADRTVSDAAPAGPRPGPRGAQGLIRSLHEGEGGPIWKWIVTLTGLIPLLMAVTGVTAWLRAEARKRAVRASAAPGALANPAPSTNDGIDT